MRSVTPYRRQARAERGAVLPLVALSLVMIMGMAALVIDVGNGWRTRRALIPATDAAALAAAQDFARGNDGCAATAGSYLAQNHAGASLAGCVPFSYSSVQGRVTVTAGAPVQTFFSATLGLGDYSVQSVTTAAWGPPATVTGLRPIGLCYAGSAALQSVVDSPPAGDTLIHIPYSKDQPAACGGASIPGNWGTVDFDGGANSNADTKAWVLSGYPGQVSFANHTVTGCSGEAHCYSGDTGALAGLANELTTLKNSGIYFTLPVFNFAENPGSNAKFHLMGVVRARLVDFKVNGSESSRFFDLLVQPGLITGTCCGPGGGASGNRVIAICGVDPNDFAACSP
jgi:Flp pilus assembly protein TadG